VTGDRAASPPRKPSRHRRRWEEEPPRAQARMCGSSTRRSTTRTAEKLEVAAWAELQRRCRHAGECHVGTRPPWFRLHRRAAPNASHSCSPPGQSAACPVLTTLICPPRSHPPNRTRSRADTPGASRAAQSVVTSKTATSRLSRRGPAAAEPEGATRQVPAALPAGVARPPGLCARGGGRPTIRGGKGHVLMATASGAPATVTTASTLTPGALSRSKKLPGVTSVTARLTRARPLSGMVHP
jgi:hypothetical protein